MTKRIYAVIDTETATLTGEVFDFGMVICDKEGKELARYDSIIKEVFENVQMMKKAFYFKKVDSFYKPNIRCNRMDVKSWAVICHDVNKLMKKHGVTTICAYNLAFDSRVISNTGRKYGGFMAIGKREQLDLWRVSCETLLQQRTFKKWCKLMGHVSPAGNYKTNAEVAYKYGIGDWEFQESHTALDDALIEKELLVRLLGLGKKINYGIISHPWRLIQDKEEIILNEEKLKKIKDKIRLGKNVTLNEVKFL